MFPVRCFNIQCDADKEQIASWDLNMRKLFRFGSLVAFSFCCRLALLLWFALKWSSAMFVVFYGINGPLVYPYCSCRSSMGTLWFSRFMFNRLHSLKSTSMGSSLFLFQTKGFWGEWGIQGSLGQSLKPGWRCSQSAAVISGRGWERADDYEWRIHTKVGREWHTEFSGVCYCVSWEMAAAYTVCVCLSVCVCLLFFTANWHLILKPSHTGSWSNTNTKTCTLLCSINVFLLYSCPCQGNRRRPRGRDGGEPGTCGQHRRKSEEHGPGHWQRAGNTEFPNRPHTGKGTAVLFCMYTSVCTNQIQFISPDSVKCNNLRALV